MTPAPIRTAIIGLSSSAVTSWASTAHLPSLISPLGKTKFQIAALCNSSVAAAQSAIKQYKLDPSTKAYGSPEDVAADPDIDFVICNTRVDKHFETILPSVKAGKDVYIEWPIASNAAHIETLVEEARKAGGKTLIGLQGRVTAPVLKLKEVIERGDIGKILSVDVRAFGGTLDREILPTGLKYFSERKVGGNPVTIGFAHVFDFVQSVVGEVVPETIGSQLQLQRPQLRIRDPETKAIVETAQSDVPDLLHLHGRLAPSAQTSPNATLSFLFRRGQPFPSTPALTWSINGTKGELRLTSPSGISLQADAVDAQIQVHHFDTDAVEDVPWDWSDVQKQVPSRARTVQVALYAYGDWKQGVKEDSGVDIEDAARRAAQIEGLFEGFRG